MWGCQVDSNFFHCATMNYTLPQFVAFVLLTVLATALVAGVGYPLLSFLLRGAGSVLARVFPPAPGALASKTILRKLPY